MANIKHLRHPCDAGRVPDTNKKKMLPQRVENSYIDSIHLIFVYIFEFYL